jgi:hypothetical protein
VITISGSRARKKLGEHGVAFKGLGSILMVLLGIGDGTIGSPVGERCTMVAEREKDDPGRSWLQIQKLTGKMGEKNRV